MIGDRKKRRLAFLGIAVVIVLAGAWYFGNPATISSDADREIPTHPIESPENQDPATAVPSAGISNSASTPSIPSLPSSHPVKSHSPNANPPAALAGPLQTTDLMISDAGAMRVFDLALDEIWVPTADGGGRAMAVRAGSAEELEQILTTSSGGASAVLYEQGISRSPLTRRIVTNEVTVKLTGDANPAEIQKQVQAIRFTQPTYAPGYLILQTGPGLAALRTAETLRSVRGVESAEAQLARLQTKKAAPNDPYFGRQWHLKFANQSNAVAGTDVNVESVWGYPAASGIRGNGIRIGIVDDGLQLNHPDLVTNVDTTNDKDWNGNDNDPSPSIANEDFHGTACAGNAAARGNNGVGVSGSAPEATLVGMRLIASVVSDTQEAEAMSYLPDLIQIKSNSWGPADDGSTLEGPGALTAASLKNAAETGRGGLGTIFTWAGGNGRGSQDNSNDDGYANSIYTIAIGALDSLSQQASYSESGANLVVTGPSSGNFSSLGITTTDLTGSSGYNSGSTSGEISDANYTQTFGGTSSSTPTVSGVIALMLQENPALGWRDVQEILIATANKVAPNDADWITNGAGFPFNHKFGAGLVDAAAAVTRARSFSKLGTQRTVALSSNATTAIPDNSATGVTRTFAFTSTPVRRVEHVTVRLTVTNVPKGQLEITLTSPSGTVSRLSETGNSTNVRYSNWTLMTVRNWGESANGTWTLRVADRRSGTTGSLTAAEVTLFGSDAPAAAANPAPTVSLTSPTNGQVFASGQAIALAASAADLTAEGGPGTISQVEFFQGTTSLGVDTIAPYAMTWSPPADGEYTFTARARDSEGAVGISPVVGITSGAMPMVQLIENFSSLTVGNHTSTTGSSTNWLGNTNFPTVTRAFQAGGVVKLGSANAIGSITSRPLNLSASGGNFSVTFDVKGWTMVEGDIVVSATGLVSQTVKYNAVMAGSFETRTVRFTGGGANTTVTLATSSRRAFIDNVSITSDVSSQPPTFGEWIEQISGLTDRTAQGDPDGDGLPNLVEFFMGLPPNEVSNSGQPMVELLNNQLSLTYRKSTSTNGVSGRAVWTTDLSSTTNWSEEGVLDVWVRDEGTYQIRKASIAMNPGERRKFLRLEVTTP